MQKLHPSLLNLIGLSFFSIAKNISLCGCAVGGMAGIKRPAEESNEAPSEKKNQPVTAKVFPSHKPATENKTPKPVNENKVHYVTHLTPVSSHRNFGCSVFLVECV